MAENKLREKQVAPTPEKGRVNRRLVARGESLLRQAEPDWRRLMATGNLLNLRGFRKGALACLRKGMSMPAHRVEAVRTHPGRKEGTLVIGFSLFNGTMAGTNLNFFRSAGLADFRRLVLWDARFQFFLGGLPPVAGDYAGLLAFLRAEIARAAPRRVIVTGSSGSGYAALLYGHALGADEIHAFSPPVCLDPEENRRLEPRNARRLSGLLGELAALPLADRALLDLRKVLRRDNGRSRIFVHYGAEHPIDGRRASFLADCPRVKLVAYPGAQHMVVRMLAKTGQLSAVFAGARPSP